MALVESRLLHHLTLRHRILVHVLLDGMGHYCLVATLVEGERERETEGGESKGDIDDRVTVLKCTSSAMSIRTINQLTN